MNSYLFRHEFSLMVKNRKNILFIIFLLIAICSYIFIILPNQDTSESINTEEIARELELISHVQKTRESRGAVGYSVMGGRNFYADDLYYSNMQSAMLHAYEVGNFKRYAYLRTHYLDSINEGLIYLEDYLPETNYPIKDYTHLSEKKLLTYQQLLNTDIPITYEIIEEKTALQVLKNLLLNLGPYFIIFFAIYFSNDVLVRDREQTTTLEGLPISWYRLINVKTLVAFLYTIFILLGLMVIGIGLLTIVNGFGSFAMEIPILGERIDNLYYNYNMLSIAKYLGMSLALAPMFILIFIRLNMIFSLLFRNEWIVLVISSLCLISEQFYFARDKREIFDKDISNFPQTYFDFGKIVTGEKNFLINMETMTYTKGLIVILSTLVLVEILVFVLTRVITKRRFYNF